MNLMKADLLRLTKDKPLRIIAIVLVAMNFLTMGMFKVLQLIGGEEMLGEMVKSLGLTSFFSLFALGNLGLMVALAVSMFVGRDFSQNTIRNKIIGGNARHKIYLSSLLLNLLIGLALLVITLVEGILLSLLFYGIYDGIGEIAKTVALYVPLYVGFIAVMTFVSLAVRTQTMGIVLNVLVVVLLPALLSVLNMANMTALHNNAVVEYILSIIPYHSIGSLSGGTISPDGMFVLPTVTGTVALKTILSSVVLAVAASAAGYALFRRADIK